MHPAHVVRGVVPSCCPHNTRENPQPVCAQVVILPEFTGTIVSTKYLCHHHSCCDAIRLWTRHAILCCDVNIEVKPSLSCSQKEQKSTNRLGHRVTIVWLFICRTVPCWLQLREG